MRTTSADLALAPHASRTPFLTYEPYYGLKEKAFSLSADPRFLYKSRIHGPAFDELRAGIRRREGLIVLTGEPGTGKTTLCRGVLKALDRKTFCTIVPDPFISREDLLKILLLDFGVVSAEELKAGRLTAATRAELSYPLYEFLKSLVPLQAYAVLIIDEAQNLSSQLLEEIRILADLEGPEKLLQLVLVGQPELRDKLKDAAMRQVDQRVSVRCALRPLERDAIAGYIAHRIGVAGGGFDTVEFLPDAIALVHEASNGYPRVINLIADRSLHLAHLDRTWTITPSIVTSALRELGLERPRITQDDFETSFPAEATVLVQKAVAPVEDSALMALQPEAPAAADADSIDEGLVEAILAPPAPPPPAPRPLLRVVAGGALVGAMFTTVVLLMLWRQQVTQALPVLTPPAAPVHRSARSVAPVVPLPDLFSPPASR